jgi:hypothetical protein
MEGGHELCLVDQPILEGEQAEEQVTRRVGCARHGGHLFVEVSQVIDGGFLYSVREQRIGRARSRL